MLGDKDMWASLPLVTRAVPRLPPEPFRFIGGRMIRRAVMDCEEAEEQNRSAPPLAAMTATLPRLFGLRIGTR